jgi:ATP-dependent Clp protease adaptor protein ClpS
MPTADTKERTKTNVALKPPGMYKVLYINDDVTTVDFVMESLMAVFNHSEHTAAELTRQVHEEGAAVVAVLPYELAEQKGVEVTILARNAGFPLQVKLEQE